MPFCRSPRARKSPGSSSGVHGPITRNGIATLSAPPRMWRSRHGPAGPIAGSASLAARSRRSISISSRMPNWPCRSSSWPARGWAIRLPCASAGPRNGCWSIALRSRFAGSSVIRWKYCASGSSSWPMPPTPIPVRPMSGPMRRWRTSTSAICRRSRPQRLPLSSMRPTRFCPRPCASGVFRWSHPRQTICAATARSAPCPPSARRWTGCPIQNLTTTAGCGSAWR